MQQGKIFALFGTSLPPVSFSHFFCGMHSVVFHKLCISQLEFNRKLRQPVKSLVNNLNKSSFPGPPQIFDDSKVEVIQFSDSFALLRAEMAEI